jgi:hypothetical protein
LGEWIEGKIIIIIKVEEEIVWSNGVMRNWRLRVI